MSVLVFLSGLLIGSLCGIAMMCLVQINRYGNSSSTPDAAEEKREEEA